MADFEPVRPIGGAWPVREPKKAGPGRKRQQQQQRRREPPEGRDERETPRRIDEFA